MSNAKNFYIDGAWVDPVVPRSLDVIDPATEEPFSAISLGSAADVDRAVAAARRAFATYGFSQKAERLALLRRILAEYEKRAEDMAQAISQEMGAPIGFAREGQTFVGAAHLEQAIRSLESFEFDHTHGDMLITREPVGVAGLITPWNWPMNQIVCKVAPAIATGCTCVLKPSEIAPLSATIFAEIMHAAGTPPGVFNLVHGDGPGVGEAIARHPGIDLVSFTGSTRAGVIVARLAADTVKRVLQELGGKSPNIILADANLADAVVLRRHGVFRQHRPILRFPLAHAGAARTPSRGDRDCAQNGRKNGHRRTNRYTHRTRARGQRGALDKNPGADRKRASPRALHWSPADRAARQTCSAAITCAPPCSPT